MKPTFLLFKLGLVLAVINLYAFIPAASNAGIVQDVVGETNQFRKSKGMPALVMNDDLNEIARQHSVDMANGRTGFGHSGFEKRNAAAKKKLGIHSFGENVAYGASNAREVMNMWKNSSGHRRNLLGRFKYIGIGIAKDRQGRIFYTQVFAG